MMVHEVSEVLTQQEARKDFIEVIYFSLAYGLGKLKEESGDTQASLGRGGLRPRKACLGVKGLKLLLNRIRKVRHPKAS